jgi:pimeloyl-ACP methyl ester carboxylesterase
MTFGGRPTRWEPKGESRGVAIVAPGRAYPPSAPLLEFGRRALLQHGFTVQQLWWDSASRADDDDAEQWVRRHVEAAHAAEEADHVLLVGKSLGTRAASYAAERGLDAIWLTPLLVDPVLAEGIAANAGRQLLVGGLRDELWVPAIARELADSGRGGGCDVLEIADADHGMGTDDAVRTAEIHLEVARAVEEFLSSL